ncbi:hypothetical protein [Staphylococcus saprophyticus]|uniref:hypothetical protein n=1 Tax=Staphylococcus saprophyticus TaxID=29385 RepID=UPI000853C1E0|nr:hypothetical protein [Staphylococcus saprophyticus]MDW4192784.1 hypothetical protein [Staphylococcus saprophyticus]MDW4263975.1 hypothetical protein [Staphylococcus saprophyticus]MDW4308703.1 hypothetical protein [Staphylococcus saprophyticus]MDW4378079.1 hypothetical protein [Staphylococcus saprophyticus]MDW4397114.1 hypothetical protein [Staphylococcus saprophyticus]
MVLNQKVLKTTISELNKDKQAQLLKEFINISSDTDTKDVLKGKDEYEEILIDKLEINFENMENAFIHFMFSQFYKYSSLFKVTKDEFNKRLETFDKNQYSSDIIKYEDDINEKAILILEEKTGVKLEGDHPVKTTRMCGTLITLIEENHENYLMISTESIPPHYRNNESTNYYIKKIDDQRNWLERDLLLNLEPLDFENTIDCLRKDVDETDFIVSAQSMNINSGAKATLDSASSQIVILPILDEIKNLMIENEALFENAKEGYNLITDYIQELEEESELPWVTLSFNRKIQVKFLFEISTRKDYTLLNYYSEDNIKRQGREGMNDVAKTMLQRYSTFSSSFSNDS